jgi:replication fork clamp-binding protein CrfC
MMHIKQTLPDIKARIASSLQKYQAELSQLGDSLLGNTSNIILNMITEFSNEYRSVLEGNNQELSSIELSGGARISFVYHELYANGVKAVDPFDQVKDVDIRTVLYNSSGSSPALFVGTMAFELIVKQQIKRLEDPSLKCVSLVYDELIRILGQLLTKPIFRRYPALKEKAHAVVVAFFKKAMEPTNKLVKDLVAMEACYINTGHPDFINGSRVSSIAVIIRIVTNQSRLWQLSMNDIMLRNQHRWTPKQASHYLHRLCLPGPPVLRLTAIVALASSVVSLHLKTRRRWPRWNLLQPHSKLPGLYQIKRPKR